MGADCRAHTNTRRTWLTFHWLPAPCDTQASLPLSKIAVEEDVKCNLWRNDKLTIKKIQWPSNYQSLWASATFFSSVTAHWHGGFSSNSLTLPSFLTLFSWCRLDLPPHYRFIFLIFHVCAVPHLHRADNCGAQPRWLTSAELIMPAIKAPGCTWWSRKMKFLLSF